MSHSRENTTIEEKNNDGPDRLSRLPDDLLKYSIFRFLPSSAQVLFGRTRQRFTDFPEYEKAKRVIKEPLKQFLFCVAHGQKDQAEALVAEDPDLLLFEGEVQDYSGRKLQGTALGIALGAEDVNLYANDGTLLGEGMVEMIQRHLRKLPDGEAEITRQTLKQFPEGWEEQEEKRHEGDLQALRKVRDAIEHSSSNEACKEAILEFKSHLASQKAITTGKHWNARLLQAAFKMGCKEYFDGYRKDNLFYKAVVGSIQALAPANYAMVQAQGLKQLLKGEKFKRDLKLKWDHGSAHYYPLSSSGLRWGADFWIDGYWGVVQSVWWVDRRTTEQLSLFFGAMLEEKQKYCDDLCRSQTSIKMNQNL